MSCTSDSVAVLKLKSLLSALLYGDDDDDFTFKNTTNSSSTKYKACIVGIVHLFAKRKT